MAQLLSPGTAREQGTAKVKRYVTIGILGAALVLALVAGVAVARGLARDPAVTAADTAAPASAEACAYASSEGDPGEGCAPIGGAPETGADTPGARGVGTGSPAWSDARDYAPVVTTPAPGDSQQARLHAIEVRDTGAGTADADGGPCRSPGRSCDR